MKTNAKFYFMGYEDFQHDEKPKTYTLLFASDKATSLYEALKEFEEYEMKNKKKFKVVKILEGVPDSEF
ncbi:MAG: hypothetical protein JG777_983 [Clostridia bacterium]|jgi:hypothetical protein|uniref:hypothetical protein n=1 Tax=Petroclostridium xylanilyticum TaxID=1792311 RepID=UPI000B9852C6|nr:hypothetical protein [Petroclostridium xylanilyticum]MBZ4645494.1 hypothetical protein [Clostridia bacterium]